MSYIRTAKEREEPSVEIKYRTREETRTGLKHVLKPFTAWLKAFSKPYTEPMKETQREAAPLYRGWHINQVDACTGCGNCAQVCMNVAIDMVAVEETTKKDTGLRPRIDYGRCCWCALCVDICATGSLRMANEYVWTGTNPDEFRYTPGVDAKPWDTAEHGWRKLLRKKKV
jgi:glutamate synthase (NADPH) small chain